MSNLVIPTRLALQSVLSKSPPTTTEGLGKGAGGVGDSDCGGQREVGVLILFCETEVCMCGGRTRFQGSMECVERDFQVDYII
jgi:hypothetical protein